MKTDTVREFLSEDEVVREFELGDSEVFVTDTGIGKADPRHTLDEEDVFGEYSFIGFDSVQGITYSEKPIVRFDGYVILEIIAAIVFGFAFSLTLPNSIPFSAVIGGSAVTLLMLWIVYAWNKYSGENEIIQVVIHTGTGLPDKEWAFSSTGNSKSEFRQFTRMVTQRTQEAREEGCLVDDIVEQLY